MIYLLYGSNNYLINQKVEEINKNIDKMSINNYNLEDTLLENIIEDASMNDLFNPNKTIIVNNAYIFNATINKKQKEQNIDILFNYLSNPNPNTTIIFITNNQKLDERKKIIKLLKDKYKVIEFNKDTNVKDQVKLLLKDYNITPNLIDLFIDRVGNDLYILENEIEKLKLYKDNNTITIEDITNLTNKNINTDIFNLIEHIINKDSKNAYIEYQEIVKVEEPIKIIIMLANQFRIIYQAKELYKKGYTENDISSYIGIHPYRIKLALSKSRNYDSELILNYLYELANIDLQIKKGLIDPSVALELFIINIK